MTFLYWMALVVGGGMFLLSLAGELFGDHGDVHHDADVHGTDPDWGKLLSIRSLTYLLFAFGATGVLLSLVWRGENDLIRAVLAVATGATAWIGSTALFNYLRRSESGERLTDRALVGKVGTVTLPLLRDGTGKVMITRGGQTMELLARPMDEKDAQPESWNSVVIVEVRDGIAFVTPYTEEPQS